MLKNDLYRGVVEYGRSQRRIVRGTKTRTKKVAPESVVFIDVPELRIVSDELFAAARARIAESAARLVVRGTRVAGSIASFRGSYLLSGHLACGKALREPRADGSTICGAPLIVQQPGRNKNSNDVCRDRREKGKSVCSNSTGVPMVMLHNAVIHAPRETLSPEKFEAHVKRTAEDDAASASRAAERATLVARIPVLRRRSRTAGRRGRRWRGDARRPSRRDQGSPNRAGAGRETPHRDRG